jgi:hypothetical protein
MKAERRKRERERERERESESLICSVTLEGWIVTKTSHQSCYFILRLSFTTTIWNATMEYDVDHVGYVQWCCEIRILIC